MWRTGPRQLRRGAVSPSKAAAAYLVHDLLVTPNDVVLINTGANQMGGDEPMMLRGVQGLVDLLRRRAGKTPHVYWRETYAQHFPEYALNTTSVGLRPFDGSFNLRSRQQGAYRNLQEYIMRSEISTT